MTEPTTTNAATPASSPPAPGAPPLGGLKIQAATNMLGMIQAAAADAADSDNHDAVSNLIRAAQNRPGVRTTEFYLALALNGAGGAMQFWPGHEQIGAVLMLGGSVAYMLSRMVIKAAAVKSS